MSDDPDHPYRYITELEVEIERLRSDKAARVSVELLQTERNVADDLRERNDRLRAEIEHLRADKAELLEVLQYYEDGGQDRAIARAAIAKVSK